SRQPDLHANHHVGDAFGVREHLRLRMQSRHLVVDDCHTHSVVTTGNITMQHSSSPCWGSPGSLYPSAPSSQNGTTRVFGTPQWRDMPRARAREQSSHQQVTVNDVLIEFFDGALR